MHTLTAFNFLAFKSRANLNFGKLSYQDSYKNIHEPRLFYNSKYNVIIYKGASLMAEFTIKCTVKAVPFESRDCPEINCLEISFLNFLRKVIRQSHTDVMSFCMQFEKIGRGLMQEPVWSKGQCAISQKRGVK